MVDLTNLKAVVDRAIAQAEKTRGTEASAAVLLASIKETVTAAVTKAIQDDDNIDNSAIAVVTEAVSGALKVFEDSDAQLGAAIANNPGSGGSTPPVA